MSFLDNLLKKAGNQVSNAATQAVHNAGNQVSNAANSALRKAENSVINAGKKAAKEVMRDKEKFKFEELPKTAEEFKALDCLNFKNPFAVAALCIVALCRFPEDKDACYDMMNILKGPQPLSERDKGFINDRFMNGKNYVPFSYFKDAEPENNYTPSKPYTIVIKEGEYSKQNFNEGYYKLFIQSGGADAERYVVLRRKNSTEEWFIWEFESLLADIRIPKEADPWA